jgi:uncharacterized membrane protein YccC
MPFLQRLLALIDGEPVIFTNLGAAIIALAAALHFSIPAPMIVAVAAFWSVFVAILRTIVTPASQAKLAAKVALYTAPPKGPIPPEVVKAMTKSGALPAPGTAPAA